MTLTASADTMLSNPPMDQSFGTLPIMRAGGGDESLVLFDLSALPTSASIQTATLKLYISGSGSTAPVKAHRTTAAWTETSTYASFAQHFDPTIIAAFTTTSTNSQKSLDVTTLVASWFSGTQSNYGVLFETSSDKKTIFVSREGGTAAQKPQLQICYTVPDDHCSVNPCQNGGTCANNATSYTCTCAPGYTGTDCETVIDNCASAPCLNGGACTSAGGSYTCSCASGYTGSNCENVIDNCAATPCQNGGTCVNGIGTYSCQCQPGFTGANCDTLIDNCANNPCLNGGTCANAVNGYTCSCASGYTGTNCQTNIDECASAPCQNGGTCVDGTNSYTCSCPAGWGGTNCDVSLQLCSQNPCLNGASCTDGYGTYTCSCVPGYAGTNCEIDIDECSPNPCLNGGTCIDGVNSFTCHCAPGYRGTNCESLATYTVGGSVSGLAGSGLVLENNNGDDLVVATNGTFTFATAIASGSTYAVTVKTQPTNPVQVCTVDPASASGTVTTSAITTVQISCTTTLHWAPSSVGLPGGGWINSIVADPTTGALYAATGLAGDSGTAGGIFKFSAASWAPVNSGVPNATVVSSLAGRFDPISGALVTIYGATRGSGVLASSDGGASWKQIGLATADVTAIAVDSHNTVWAGTATGQIYKLPDHASAWIQTSTSTLTPIVAFAEDVNATPDPLLYAQAAGGAATGGGLLEIDSVLGSTWTTNNVGLVNGIDCSYARSDASALAIDASQSATTLYWGSENCGLLARSASSNTWSVVGGLASEPITHVVLGPGTPASLWATDRNRGVAYVPPGGSAAWLTNASAPAWKASTLAYANGTLYAGSVDGRGVFASGNPTQTSGGSFASFNNKLSNIAVRFLVRDPSSVANVFAAGDPFGVAFSNNGGLSWTVGALPVPCPHVAALAYDPFSTKAFLLCQGVPGVFVGSGATSWTLSQCAGLSSSSFSPGMAIDLGTTPNTLYFATTDGSSARLWSTDASGASAGAICTEFAPGLPTGTSDVSALAIGPGSSLYVGSPGNYPLTYAPGAGAAWTRAQSGPKSVVSFFMDTHPTVPIVYAAGHDDGTGTGGVWSGSTSTVGVSTTVTWAPDTGSGITASSNVTAFDGRGTNSSPSLFAAITPVPGQPYAPMFESSATSSWTWAANGIVGGGVQAIAFPGDTAFTAVTSLTVLVGTSGGGVYRSSTGGQ